MKRYWFVFLISSLLILSAVSCKSDDSQPPSLTKCLNIGNSLEAPKNQPWNVPMDISYFSIIKEAGFESVRLPVRFSDYTSEQDNYHLDETFMLQIDRYIQEAFNQDLTLILDFHHFIEIMDNPQMHRDKLVAIWEQLANRYKDYSEKLVFEILNEPQKNLNSDLWNDILAETVTAIRKFDNKHYLIVGGVSYNSIDSLSSLKLPQDDRLIATFHYYEPNDVTFQGNPFHAGYEHLNNISWTATEEELTYLKERLTAAKNWAEQNQVTLFLGEFGISNAAPAETRITWTKNVAREAASLGISCAYWEFASDFGVYNLSSASWNQEMLDALLKPSN